MDHDFRSEELASHHKRELFHGASQSIEEYLRTLARKQDRNNSTRVHVYANGHGRIAGYFTPSAATLELRDLPEEIQRGRPKFPLPATLLGRFGVDREFENRGLGSLLLGLALVNAYTASKTRSFRGRLTIASDASERASALYRKYGFLQLPSDTNRMILMMSVVRKNLDREDRLE